MTYHFFVSHRLAVAEAAIAKGWQVAVVGPANTLIEKRCRRLGIRVIPWNLSRSGLHPFAELKSLFQLGRIYRSWQPDIVHHVTPKPVLYGSIVAKLAKIPAVINAVSGLGFLFGDSTRSGFLRKIVLGLHRRFGRRRRVGYIFQNPDDKGSLPKVMQSPEAKLI